MEKRGQQREAIDSPNKPSTSHGVLKGRSSGDGTPPRLETALKEISGAEEDICSVCLEQKTSPVHISCGHSFCERCLSIFGRYRNRYRWARRCPICRVALNCRRRYLTRQHTSTNDAADSAANRYTRRRRSETVSSSSQRRRTVLSAARTPTGRTSYTASYNRERNRISNISDISSVSSSSSSPGTSDDSSQLNISTGTNGSISSISSGTNNENSHEDTISSINLDSIAFSENITMDTMDETSDDEVLVLSSDDRTTHEDFATFSSIDSFTKEFEVVFNTPMANNDMEGNGWSFEVSFESMTEGKQSIYINSIQGGGDVIGEIIYVSHGSQNSFLHDDESAGVEGNIIITASSNSSGDTWIEAVDIIIHKY